MPSLVRHTWFLPAFAVVTICASAILFFIAPWPAIPLVLRQLIDVLIVLAALTLPILTYEIIAAKNRARYLPNK